MNGRVFLRRMWVLMATVFIDMLGFFIVLPLLPFYAQRLGADPTRIGGLVSAFAIAQVATAPLWGRLSDRYGRRPMILGGLLMSAVAYVLFENASAVWLLFVSRFVQGAGGGTTGVVQAYLSDSVPRRERAKALGWLTAATSAGVMAGPAVGSLAAALGTIAPGYLAAGFCVVNLLFAWRWLPEPERAHDPSTVPKKPSSMRSVFVDVLKHPRGPVGSLIWIYTFGMMSLMAMSGMLALYLQERFGIDETTIGYFYVFVGGVSLVMRSLVLGPIVQRFGEVRVLRLGTLSMALGMATIPLAASIPQLGLAIALVPIGTAFLFPVTTSIVSGQSEPGRTGTVLGVQQTFGGLARMLGPLWAGIAFQHLHIGSPFWICAGVMVATFLFSSSVKPIDHVEPQPGTEVPLSPEAS